MLNIIFKYEHYVEGIPNSSDQFVLVIDQK